MIDYRKQPSLLSESAASGLVIFGEEKKALNKVGVNELFYKETKRKSVKLKQFFKKEIQFLVPV